VAHSRIEEVMPNIRVVNCPECDLCIELAYSLKTRSMGHTWVANAKTFVHGNVHPAAWNIGRILMKWYELIVDPALQFIYHK